MVGGAPAPSSLREASRRSKGREWSPFGPGDAGAGAPALVVVRTNQRAGTKQPPASSAQKRPKPLLPEALRNARQPKYIEHCQFEEYHLRLENKVTGEQLAIPFKCKSWRHEGSECQRHRAQKDFARIREGLKTCAPGSIVLMVLTLDRPKENQLWKTRTANARAYTDLVTLWTALHRDITSSYGTLTGRVRKRERTRKAPRYVATLEAHKTGWPHLNVLMECQPLADDAYDFDQEHPETGHAPEGAPIYSKAQRWLKSAAKRAGFGQRATITRVTASSADEAASYITKWESTENAAGEVTKRSQLPLNAPPGTRRLRASKGFLPKKPRQTDWTGELKKFPLPAEDAAFLAEQLASKQGPTDETGPLERAGPDRTAPRESVPRAPSFGVSSPTRQSEMPLPSPSTTPELADSQGPPSFLVT